MKTGQQWGDLVRSYFPGYTGHRPRLQHWHGTADTTLELHEHGGRRQGVDEPARPERDADGTDTPKSGTTHQFWKNSCFTVYETFALSGVGHAVPFDGNAVAAYFGLDKAGGQDPETAACPGAMPGTGAGGAGGGAGSGAGGRGGSVARRARAVAAGRARAAPLAGATAASTPLPTAAAARRTAAVQGAERRAAREPAAARRARAGAWPPALAVRSAALAAAQPAAAAPPAPPGPAIRRARRATAQPADPAAPLRERPVPQAAPARRARARAKIRAAAAAARSPFSRQAALPPRSCWPSHR